MLGLPLAVRNDDRTVPVAPPAAAAAAAAVR
jgi:hypothetical protein